MESQPQRPGTGDFLAFLADGELFRMMLIACPDGVIAADNEDRILLYTGASERLFGFAPVDMLHQPVRRLFADETDYQHFRAVLQSERQVVNLQVEAVRKDGAPFVAAISAAMLRDRFGEPANTVIYVRDYTDVKAIEDALRDHNRRLNELVRTLHYVAQHDRLTGLLYRASAMEAADAALLAMGTDARVGVVLLDLDHFKVVNDSYGHLIGDEVLAALAAVLTQNVRQDDIIGRFGGEEFVVFLPGVGVPEAVAFSERVRVAVGQCRVPAGPGHHINVTVSAGVAAFPEDGPGIEGAIRVADARLLAAKRAGRNRVVAEGPQPGRTAA